MLEKAIELQGELELSLEQIEGEADQIKRCTLSLRAIEGSIWALFDYYSLNQFLSIRDEISFFKVSSPFFLSKYLYFHKVVEAEIIRRHSTRENLKLFLQKILGEIDFFTNSNADFLLSYYVDSPDEDEQLFTRRKNPANWIRNDYSRDIPLNFSEPSTKIATTLANIELRLYIEQLIQEIEMPAGTVKDSSLQFYGWEGASKAAAWELLNKLAEKKIIFYKGAPADKKRVAEFGRLALNLSLGNIYEVDRKNRSRKKDQFPFLRSLLDESPIVEA